MRYFKIDRMTQERKEISYEEAVKTIMSVWGNNDRTHDMLSIPNRITCGFSVIETQSREGYVLMAGLYNQLPMDAEYDKEGNRID